MLDYSFNNSNNFPTKHEIIKPITNYIEQKVSKKELLKYYHLNFCNMTRLQHEIYWVKRQLSKIFNVGFYSKKQQNIMRNILQQIIDRDKQDWIHKTYYSD